MSKVDWGTVPTWISAIVTTVALGTTALVIWRDRRKDHRHDADRLLCWTENEDSGTRVWVRNASERSVHHPTIIGWSWPGEDKDPNTRIAPQLLPGEDRSVLLAHTKKDGEPRIVAVYFRDAGGTRWAYDVRRQALRTVSSFKRRAARTRARSALRRARHRFWCRIRALARCA